MNLLNIVCRSVNMIYLCCYYLVAVVRLVATVLWYAFGLIGAGTPWLLAAVVALWCAGQVARVRQKRQIAGAAGKSSSGEFKNNGKSTQNSSSALARFLMLTPDDDEEAKNASADLLWTVAHRGADLDAPANSVAALKMCRSQRCHKVLLDLACTQCGELVILHKTTIAGSSSRNQHKADDDDIDAVKLADLQDIDIAKQHTMHSKFNAEPILTLAQLLHQLNGDLSDMTVFLLLSASTKPVLEALCKTIAANESLFRDRIVICSDSLYALYKLRKSCAFAVSGLWIDKAAAAVGARSSSSPSAGSRLVARLVRYVLPVAMWSKVRAVLYHFVAPLLGVAVVFLYKDEYNACIQKSWLSAGVRPIVYPVNSPNEKLYFQRYLRTPYLTGSLRTELSHLVGKP